MIFKHPVLTAKKTTRLHDNDQLMLFKEIIAVYSENRTKHINTLWAKYRVTECYDRWYSLYIKNQALEIPIPEVI
jgi:hypothetical protein